MINNVVLVGRIVDEPRFLVTESGYHVVNFTLAIRKDTKDVNSEYESDFFPVSAWNTLADIVRDYVHKGSVIGARCHLATRTTEIGGKNFHAINIIAENVSFISLTNKPKEVEPLDEAEELIAEEVAS